MTYALPARIRFHGYTFTRVQVQRRVDEVAAAYRMGEQVASDDTLTEAAIAFLQDGVLALDNYTTR